MKFVNPEKVNALKQRVDTTAVENKPFGAGFMKAYIERPVAMIFDFFRKVKGSSFGNKSSGWMMFHTHIQWIALEYTSDIQNSAKWNPFKSLVTEYGDYSHRIELTQTQYNMLAFHDQEYDTIEVVSDQFWPPSGQFSHAHDHGISPVLACSSNVAGGVSTTSQFYGVDVNSNEFSGTAPAGTNRRVMAMFHNHTATSMGTEPSATVYVDDDKSVNAHLVMHCCVDVESGTTIEKGGTVIVNDKTHMDFMAGRIVGGSKLGPRVLYSRYGAGRTPEILYTIPSQMASGNQNMISHSFSIPSQSVRSAFAATALYSPYWDQGPSKLRYDIDREKRYSLTVLTEPYQVMGNVDQGINCEYEAVSLSGANGTVNNMLAVRGNHSTLVAIDAAIGSGEYNNDIIDCITISDTSILDTVSDPDITQFVSGVERVNAGIGDVVVYGSIQLFTVDADLIGAENYEAIRYRYPLGKVVVVGAGSVIRPSESSTAQSIKLYCAGVDPERTDIAFTPIHRNISAVAGTGITIDRNGERLGPVVKIPGVPGYVRIVSKTMIKTDRNGWQDSAVYSVELPYMPMSQLAMEDSAGYTTNGFVMKPISYIKAGSWRRYEASEDNDPTVKLDPTTMDYQWLGINERSDIEFGETNLSWFGPYELFYKGHLEGSNYKSRVMHDYMRKTRVIPSSQSYTSDRTLSVDVSAVTATGPIEIRRLTVVGNTYWKSMSGYVGYHGMEYPSYEAKFSVEDIGNIKSVGSAIHSESRWFVGRAIGGGLCNMDENVGPGGIFMSPFIKNDLGLWMLSGRTSEQYWRRMSVASRDTSISSIITTNLLCDGLVDTGIDISDGTSGHADSRVISVTLKNSDIVMPGLKLFRDAAVAVPMQMLAYPTALYNTNIQCLYFAKSVVDGKVYCSTRSYKVIDSEFTLGATIADDRLRLYCIVEDLAGVDDAKSSIEHSLFAASETESIGLINILDPQTNSSSAASSIVETSRIFHVFSNVPNTYKGNNVQYIGVYNNNSQASAVVQDVGPNQYCLYYNSFENSFFVWTGTEWVEFYRVDDWVGIKTRFLDSDKAGFVGAGSDTTSPEYNLSPDGDGSMPGTVVMRFGHQPKRFPLPEHIDAYVAIPPPHVFVSSIYDGDKPETLSLRYIGFSTKAVR